MNYVIFSDRFDKYISLVIAEFLSIDDLLTLAIVSKAFHRLINLLLNAYKQRKFKLNLSCPSSEKDPSTELMMEISYIPSNGSWELNVQDFQKGIILHKCEYDFDFSDKIEQFKMVYLVSRNIIYIKRTVTNRIKKQILLYDVAIAYLKNDLKGDSNEVLKKLFGWFFQNAVGREERYDDFFASFMKLFRLYTHYISFSTLESNIGGNLLDIKLTDQVDYIPDNNGKFVNSANPYEDLSQHSPVLVCLRNMYDSWTRGTRLSFNRKYGYYRRGVPLGKPSLISVKVTP